MGKTRSIARVNPRRQELETDPDTGAELEPIGSPLIETAPALAPDAIVADEPDEVYIRRTIEGMGDVPGAMVRIFRQGRDARDLEYLDEFPIQDWTPSRVQGDHGPGTYRILVQDDQGHLRLNRMQRIGPRRRPADPVNGADLATALLAGFKEITAGMVQAITAAIPRAPERDTLADFEKLSTVVKNLMPPPVAPVAPTGKPFEDVLAALTVMDKIKALNPAPIEKGGDIGGALAIEAVRQFGPVLSEAMRRGPPAGASAPATTVTPAAQLPPPANHAEGETVDTDTIIAAFVGQLVMHAEKNRNVAAYSEMVLDALDDMPDELAEEIIKRLQADAWLSELARYDNRVPAFGEWFGKLRAAVVDAYKEDEPENPSPAV